MKKLLYVVLAFCLLLTLAACGGNEAGATTGTTEDAGTGNGVVSNHVHCVCVGKSKGVGAHTACSEKDGWNEIGTAEELVNAINAQKAGVAGYYALTADITIDTYLEIPQDMKVNLCLNGHTLSASTRNFGEYNVTDCKGTGLYTSDKTFTIRGYASSSANLYSSNYTISGSKLDSQALVFSASIEEGMEHLVEGPVTVNLYGCKLYRDPTKVSSKVGANLWMGLDSKVTMYGGTITGANVETTETSGAAKGANVCIWGSGANFTMHGGEVTNGSIKQHDTSGYGGNIGMWNGELHIFGGTVSGGYASYYGGNISTNNKPTIVELKDAIIKDGVAAWKFGGNIYLGAADTEVIITNTTISGGQCTEAGGNFFANNTKVVTFENCTISDGVAPDGGAISMNGRGIRIVLKGEMKFSNNGKSDIFMREYSSQKSVGILSVAGLTGKAPIVVNCTREQELTEDTCADGLLVAAEGYTITKAADGKMSIKVN